MKSIVVYFSLTGSTEKIARAIHKGMSQVVAQCAIAAVKEMDPGDLAGYDLIGLGCPVWGGVPPAFQLFMDRMPSLQGKHSFVFYTHGAKPFCLFPYIAWALHRKGATVVGVGDWYGAVNIPYLPKPYPTDRHPDKTDLMHAEGFGKEMVEISRRISAGETDLIPPLPAELPPRVSHLPRSTKTLNTKKCKYPECTLCMDNCPMGYIDLTKRPPVYPRKCEPCYFCEIICPEGAIEVDYDRTPGTPPTREQVEGDLDEAESEGRFRRLMTGEEVDWNTPYFKSHSQHPLFVITRE
jgi:ferredoxin